LKLSRAIAALARTRLQTDIMFNKQPLSRSIHFVLATISFAFLASCATLISTPTAPITATTISLRFIGEQTIPHRAELAGTTFGGISGMDYDAKRNVFYLLSDDRSQNGPSRFYTARIALTASDLSKPEILSSVVVKRPDGQVHGDVRSDPQNVLDPEAIRYLAATDTLLWTSEGDKRLNLSPFVREMKLDGTFVRELPTLPMFAMKPGEAGPRENATYEGMTMAPDGKSVWVAMESALFEDGPTPNVDNGGAPLRITHYDAASGKALRQIAYQPDAIPHRPMPANGAADNGVPEILMLDQHRMLVLERSFSQGVGNSIRIYAIDARDGSDTKELTALTPGNYTAVKKTLVINFDSLNLRRLDNSEAMSFGPRLANGNRTLIVASDDNFNQRQINQFLAFEVIEK
jgi:hypothetical protein